MAVSNSATVAAPSATSTNREDLKQTAMLHAATQAPLVGLLPTRNITNKRPRVLMDELATPSAAGHIEQNSTDNGGDQFTAVGDYEGQAQRWVQEWSVTREQSAHSSAVSVDKENAKEKSLKQLLRNKEYTFYGDQDKVADVPGTTGGVTEGLGSITDPTNTNFAAAYRTKAASVYTGAIADFDDTALNVVLASMFGEGGDYLDLHLLAFSGLRTNIVANMTRTAGTASKVDYNMNGTAVIPYNVEMYDSDFGQVKIINANPQLAVAADTTTKYRGYVIDPAYLEFGQMWGEGSEEYEDRGAGPVGACDCYGSLLSQGPNRLGKIESSDESNA
jgi:hypothetical protein